MIHAFITYMHCILSSYYSSCVAALHVCHDGCTDVCKSCEVSPVRKIELMRRDDSTKEAKLC
jgi:hypothetical protein